MTTTTTARSRPHSNPITPASTKIRIERTSPGANRWRITSGIDSAECDADISTAKGVGAILLAATMELGNSCEVISEVKRLTTYLRQSGCDEAGPPEMEMREAFQAIALATAPALSELEAPDPDIIDIDREPLPDLSTNVLPLWAAGFVEHLSVAKETPISMALLLALAGIASTVQRKYILQLEPSYHDPRNHDDP